MSSPLEAVTWGKRDFKAEDIIETELTMAISNLYYVMETESSEDLKRMVRTWRDKLVKIRFALRPFKDEMVMAVSDIILDLKLIVAQIQAVAVSCPDGRWKMYKGVPHNLLMLVAAYKSLYIK